MAPAPRPTNPSAPGGRVSRAATRYRPGKVAPGLDVSALDSDDSDVDEAQREQQQPKDELITDLKSGQAALRSNRERRTAGVVIETGSDRLAKVDVRLEGVRLGEVKREEKGGDESSEYETDTDEEEEDEKPAPKPVFRPPGSKPAAAQVKEEESSEYETDSEEEESSSEEEEKQLLKPVFVPKRARATINTLEAQAAAADEAERKREEEAEARRMESHLLAADRIKRELAEKENEDSKPDLDDTDGLDPEAEFAAWRLRELERLKRERDAQAEKEALEAEKERRRNLTEEQRLKEDLDKAKKSREEKTKGSQGFLQKYYHKGAFFQDMEILKKHDFTEGTSRDAVDRSLLPKAMQVRDFGKRSRSKWTHLANEDTSRKQYVDPRFRDGEGGAAAQETMGFAGRNGAAPPTAGGGGGAGLSCFNCGGPHLKRDCPNLGGGAGPRGAGQGPSATGANRTETSSRAWGRPSTSEAAKNGRTEDADARVPSKREREGSPEGSHSRRRRWDEDDEDRRNGDYGRREREGPSDRSEDRHRERHHGRARDGDRDRYRDRERDGEKGHGWDRGDREASERHDKRRDDRDRDSHHRQGHRSRSRSPRAHHDARHRSREERR